MTKMLVLLAITSTSLLIGTLQVFQAWRSIPSAPAPTLPNWSSKKSPSRQAQTDQVRQLVENARVALLNHNITALDELAKRAPGDEVARTIATAFRNANEAAEQVALYRQFLREENFDRLVEVYATLHTNQKLCEILRPNDVADPAENSAPPAAVPAVGDEQRLVRLRTATGGMLDQLHEPFDRFLVWRAIARVAKNFGKDDLAQRRFEDCVVLCGEALSHPGSLASKDRDEIDNWHYQAREQLDWRQVDTASDDQQKMDRLQAYIKKYGKPPQRDTPIHLGDATFQYADLDLRQVTKALPPPVAKVIETLRFAMQKLPDEQRQSGSVLEEINLELAGLNLEAHIQTLHSYCGKHAERNPLAPAEPCPSWLVARAAAALLLRSAMANSPTLVPAAAADLKEVNVRRDKTKFVGRVMDMETNDQIVTMQDPANLDVRRFFQAALLDKPQYIEESRREHAYRAAFDGMLTHLANFNWDWDTKRMQGFITACEARGIDERIKLAESLAALVDQCAKFRKLQAAAQNGNIQAASTGQQ